MYILSQYVRKVFTNLDLAVFSCLTILIQKLELVLVDISLSREQLEYILMLTLGQCLPYHQS